MPACTGISDGNLPFLQRREQFAHRQDMRSVQYQNKSRNVLI